MTRPSFDRIRRAFLATVLLGVIALSVLALTVSSTPAAPGANCTYYSNASHTTVVGQFGRDCCNNVVAWGVKSKFYVCGGCFICYPPPR